MRNLIYPFNSKTLSAYKFLIFFFLLICHTQNLRGATIHVGPSESIQEAIDKAQSGDTIQLAAGTYVQQVQVISKDLNIVGAGLGEEGTIIKAPPADVHLTLNFVDKVNGMDDIYWCVLIVDNQAAPKPQVVNISQLTVDGGTQQDAKPGYWDNDNFFAIGYHNASGILQNVTTKNTKQSTSFNEWAGGGIVSIGRIGTLHFKVNECLITSYQEYGIYCSGSPESSVIISNNTINPGPISQPVPGPYVTCVSPMGIKIGACSGSITNNVIEGHLTAKINEGRNSSAVGTGIKIYSSNLTISDNQLIDNDIGIDAQYCENNFTIHNNTINFTDTYGEFYPLGIYVSRPDGITKISSNLVKNHCCNMYFYSNVNKAFELEQNQFIGGKTGLRIKGDQSSAGPLILMDKDSFAGTEGYYVEMIDAYHNIWPSSKDVSYDGLICGHISKAQFDHLVTKVMDKNTDPVLGRVIKFVPQD